MKTRNTKKALFASVLSLVLCFTMLIGTTFAWFTDSVTSANNIIKSGNLDIELYYQNDSKNAWTQVTETTNIFKQDTLWEPGHTEVIKLKVANEGTLALKYQLGINIASEIGSVNVAGEEFKLSDYIYFGVVDGNQDYDRASAIAAVKDKAVQIKTGILTNEDNLSGMKNNVVNSKELTLVVYMPETVGNEANYAAGAAVPTINLGLNLFATQYTEEKDSFNNLYDANAKYPVTAANAKIKIESATGQSNFYEELNDAFKDVKDNDKITVLKDLTLAETAVFNKAVNATLDLGGKTVSGEIETLLKVADGTLNIKNGSLKNVHAAATETKYSIHMSGDAVAEIKDVNITTSGVGIYLAENAKITELNANIDSFMNANGYCCFDAVSLVDNARIDQITGGNYVTRYTDEYIQGWFEKKYGYSGTDSFTINLNGDNVSVGTISGGTFLGVMDKGNNGTPIHVNNGTVELISGGYFGFVKTGLTEPQKLLFANAGNNGTIQKITGGTFEKGSWAGFGCDFAGIVDASGCKAEETGETVDVNIQFSTKVTTYTLELIKVSAK